MKEPEASSIFQENIGRQCGDKCPECGSDNVYLRPEFPQWFWGCYKCKHGFWEQYLPKIRWDRYPWIHNMTDNSKFFTISVIAYEFTPEYRAKQAELRKKKQQDEGPQQLSLF
jgi:ssDNA-binding Zn-finger/Zn-ribbon topoisomerase 1